MRINSDRHKNIFWSYDGNPEHENNITKAIINYLQYSPLETQIDILAFVLGDRIDLREIAVSKVEYSLQAPDYDAKDFKHRYLLGVSPTGKTWSGEMQDFFYMTNLEELNRIKKQNKKKIGELLLEKGVEVADIVDVKEVIDDIIDIKKAKGGSVPDAWIYIFSKDTPSVCLAVENKKWDLDPAQLGNHLEKSLGGTKNSEDRLILMKYEDLYCQIAKNADSVIKRNLLEYLYYLGYQPFLPFEEDEFQYTRASVKENWWILEKKWLGFIQGLMAKHQLEFNTGNLQLWFEGIGEDIGNVYVEPTISAESDNVLVVSTEIGVKVNSGETYNNLLRNTKGADLSEICSVYQEGNAGYESECSLFAKCGNDNNMGHQKRYLELRTYENLIKLANDCKGESGYTGKLTRRGLIKLLARYGTEPDEQIKRWDYSAWFALKYIRIITYMKEKDVICSEMVLGRRLIDLVERHKAGLKLLRDIITRNS